jgi:NAD(P)-dependent dehydrogenase (short-subunit alcohol dehydrogenase family)
MSITLNSKTAIITGASSGIGQATALLLAESGVQVALVSRNSGKRWRSLCVST